MTFEIKICGITTPEAITAAAQAGATSIGLVFSPSKRQVNLDQARELARATPPALTRIAVFRHPPAELVAKVLASVPIDLIQSDAGDYPSLKSILGATPFRPVYRDGPDLAANVAAGAAAGLNHSRILVEGPISGSGLTPDWSRIARLQAHNLILAGGLTPGNVAQAIRTVRPAGIDTSSGVESAPGIKDPDLIFAFVKAAKTAAAELNLHGVHR